MSSNVSAANSWNRTAASSPKIILILIFKFGFRTILNGVLMEPIHGCNAFFAPEWGSEQKDLRTAVSSNDTAALQRLLERGAELPQSSTAMNLMHIATKNNNIEIVRLLLEHGGQSMVNEGVPKTGWTPLHYAAKYGSTELMLLLLEHGASESVSRVTGDAFHGTPLMLIFVSETIPKDVTREKAHLLIAHGAVKTMHTLSSEKEPALFFAIKHGDVELVRYCLDHSTGAVPDYMTESNHVTALHVAAKYTSTAMVELLISRGAAPMAKIATITAHNTPFSMAVIAGKNDIAAYLVPHTSREEITRVCSLTPFFYDAIRSNNIELVGFLLEYGAPEIFCRETKTACHPLAYAIAHASNQMCALIPYGKGVIDAPLNDGMTLIALAVHYDRIEVAKMLLGLGARAAVNTPAGKLQWTPLQIAAKKGNLPMLQLLLENGAAPSVTHFAQNKDTCSPLHLVARLAESKIGPEVQIAMMELLFAHGAKVTIPMSFSQHPPVLFYAMQHCDEKVVMYLLAHSAPGDILMIQNQMTLFHHAILRRFPLAVYQIIAGIVGNQSLISEQNQDGNTPLHLAVLWGNINIIRLLLLCSCTSSSLNVQNNEGHTPYSLALKGNFDEVILFQLSPDVLQRDIIRAGQMNTEGKSSFLFQLATKSYRGTGMQFFMTESIHFTAPVGVALIAVEGGLTRGTPEELLYPHEKRELLIAAAHAENLAIVERVFPLYSQEKLNLSSEKYNQNTALHLVLKCGCLRLAMMLYQQGARLDIPNGDGKLPIDMIENDLIKAAAASFVSEGFDEEKQRSFAAQAYKLGNIDFFISMAPFFPPSFFESDFTGPGTTILMLAIENSKWEFVEWLLGRNEVSKCISRVSQYNSTPLMKLIRRGGERCLELLLQKGAQDTVNHQDVGGWTALHYAAKFHNDGMLATLLKFGAQPSVYLLTQDPFGWGVIQCAFAFESRMKNQQGARRVVKLLLEAGGRVDSVPQADGGRPLLMQALFAGADEETIRMLIGAGARADMNNVTGGGFTYLHAAARSCCAERVRYVLENGGVRFLELWGSVSATPLYQAVKYNKPATRVLKIVSLLLHYGAYDSVDKPNIDQVTPEDALLGRNDFSPGDKQAVITLLREGKKIRDEIRAYLYHIRNLLPLPGLKGHKMNTERIFSKGKLTWTQHVYRGKTMRNYYDETTTPEFRRSTFEFALRAGNVELAKRVHAQGVSLYRLFQSRNTASFSCIQEMVSLRDHFVQARQVILAHNPEFAEMAHKAELHLNNVVKALNAETQADKRKTLLSQRVQKEQELKTVWDQTDSMQFDTSYAWADLMRVILWRAERERAPWMVQVFAMLMTDEMADYLKIEVQRAGSLLGAIRPRHSLTREHIVRYIERGADPNAVDAEGMTPLRLARRYGTEEVEKTLLEYGATE